MLRGYAVTQLRICYCINKYTQQKPQIPRADITRNSQYFSGLAKCVGKFATFQKTYLVARGKVRGPMKMPSRAMLGLVG